MVEFSSLGEPLITMEGMGESDQRPARKTASETVSLFFAILISIASFVCVLCFKPPLQGKLKKMREEHMPQPRIMPTKMELDLLKLTHGMEMTSIGF